MGAADRQDAVPAAPYPLASALVEAAVCRFAAAFGAYPTHLALGPGRVNLIGEHTDYNEGFVLPFAIDRHTVAALRLREDRTIRLTTDFDGDAAAALVETTMDDLGAAADLGWAAYPVGVAWALSEHGADLTTVRGFDLALTSDVPVGAGLSSSAAIESAVALALDAAWGLGLDRPTLARVGQRAENVVVGAPTGIMDQSASLLGETDAAVFLDCRTLVADIVPLGLAEAGLAVLVIDTRVSHAHADGGYAARRAACERGAAALGVPALRDLGEEDLERAQDVLDDETFRRVRHVVTEDARVLAAVEAVRHQGPSALGPLLLASHASMRDDFEISIPELDLAVETAVAAGALGARMTGGGFGGAAIALVPVGLVDAVQTAVAGAFAAAGFMEPGLFTVRAAAGAAVLPLPGLVASTIVLREDGAEPAVIAAFADAYRRAAAGDTGLIREASIAPLLDPPQLTDVQVSDAEARAALQATVMIKLNGGLGTSMGLEATKGLIPVRDGKTFIDVTVEQVRWARRAYAAPLPLLFMNSFRTRTDTLAHLARYPDLAVDGIPLDFIQSREPKLRRDDLTPVRWPADPSLEWCPPGHGDVYPTLWGSGLLDLLIARGFRYASLANGDNLGAAPDARLAGWFAASGAPYAAEVCTRTPNDRKGGHLAVRRADGQLVLRDSAQTADQEQVFFQDEHVHPYFHANNLWLDLVQVKAVLDARGGVLGLPLIRNDKPVDPRDLASTPIVQLESAMGAAIEVFAGAQAIAVGRDRFVPVKSTNELLLMRSDVFEVGQDWRLRATSPIPAIDLDPRFFRRLSDFEERVQVVPSLRSARSLTVRGDWRFEAPFVASGDVDVVLPTLPRDSR